MLGRQEAHRPASQPPSHQCCAYAVFVCVCPIGLSIG